MLARQRATAFSISLTGVNGTTASVGSGSWQEAGSLPTAAASCHCLGSGGLPANVVVGIVQCPDQRDRLGIRTGAGCPLRVAAYQKGNANRHCKELGSEWFHGKSRMTWVE
jgi:hypothetical protein